MKTKSFYLTGLCLLLLALFCVQPIRASRQESVKKKEITKNFKVGSNDRLQVDNRYGNINVTYWNKNEVALHIVIEAKAQSDEQAQDCIDGVKIQMEKTGNIVSAVTSLQKNWDGGGNFSFLSFSINYFIQMPERFTCELEQLYGNIRMPEENKGRCTLHAKYGNIEGGSFSAPLSIELKYGNVTIADVDEATLDVAYGGEIDIKNATKLIIESSYTNCRLGEVRLLDIDANYGNLKISRLDEGKMDLKYSNCRLGALQKRLSVSTLSYGNFDIDQLATNFETVRMNARYGNMTVRIPSDASFQVTANDMRYDRCQIQGFDVEHRNRPINHKQGFDSRDIQRNADYRLDINGGKHGQLFFEGNNNSNLKVVAE